MKPDDQTLQDLVEGIVSAVHPLRILVFGSAASGRKHPDSDIDLLVVMPEGVRRRKTAQQLYRQLRGIGVPFDILVVTPGDLEKHKNNLGLIYHAVLRDGRQVYAAA